MTRSAYPLARTALAAVMCCAAPDAWTAQVAGVTLPPTESVQGRQLWLAGCAVRESLWMELYAVSLYLPQGTPTEAGRILDDGTTKMLRLDVTYDGRVPDGLPQDWARQLRDEVSRDFVRTLRNQYNRLKAGDTVRISYVPSQGTTLSVNGDTVTTRPGGEVMDGMLGLWIGRDPVSGNMKRLLLSGSC
jgi:hypothetical protein